LRNRCDSTSNSTETILGTPDKFIRPLSSLLLCIIASCACPAWAQTAAQMAGTSMRYVSMAGSDSSDGSSWLSAMKTVAAAVNSLPTNASPGFHYGTIYIAPGTFVETATPIEMNAHLHLICTSAGNVGGWQGQGSVIQLANGRNTSLFSYTSDFAAANGYAHYVQVDNCTFDGNSTNNSLSTAGLIQIHNGGYANSFHNVTFENANGYALYLDNHAVNFTCYSCSFGSNNGGALHIDDRFGGNVVSFIDTQIDNSGTDPILIEQEASDVGASNLFTFINLKTEAFTGSTAHRHIINFKPRTAPYGNPANISILGLTAINTIGTGDSVLYESNGLGIAANWEITGLNSINYPKAFKSDKTGQLSAGSSIKSLIASDTSLTYAYTPDVELSGGAAIRVGKGGPEGVVGGVVGTLYLRLDGGAGTTLYVKETGVSNTGWKAK
jgi:hypothetical protein